MSKNPHAACLPACIASALGLVAFSIAAGAAPAAKQGLLANWRTHKNAAHAATARSASVPALVSGAIVPVTSCADDGGFDTLRHAVLIANSGDTVDLSGLACSTITLQSGALAVGLADLTIVGPGRDRLTIDGNHVDRVFTHTGTGTLTLRDVRVANGTLSADKAYGGCILTKGNLTLYRAAVSGCTALGQSEAVGGGVVSYQNLIVRSSLLSGNVAAASVGTADTLGAAGGGAFAVAQIQVLASVVSGNTVTVPIGKSYGGGVVSSSLTAKYSTFSANGATAEGTSTNYAAAGAAFIGASATILGSTFDHNTADADALLFHGDPGVDSATVVDSTISSNDGRLGIGALSATMPISLLNSTIAFNTSGPVAPVGAVFSDAVTAQNSIFADNAPADVAAATIGGGHNIIKIVAMGTTVPMDTIALDPKLGPLSLNGGPTRTHALLAGSPAIEAGPATSTYDNDQRGPTYRRVVGAKQDIGAYEVDTDHVFGAAFDYPLLP
jgi:hypothetical protein